MAAAVVLSLLGDATSVTNAFQQAEKRGKLFGSSAIWKAGALAAAGMVAKIGTELYQLGAEFDEAYANIRRATGATGETWNALEGEFKDTLGSLPESMDEVSSAFGTVATIMADSTVEEMGRITEASFDLARVTGDDGVQVAENFSRIAGAFGIDGADAVGVLDTLTRVTVDYGIGAGDLTRQLQKQAPFLSAVGLNAEEAALAMGKLFAAGIDARRVGSALSYFADTAVRAGKDPAVAMAEVEEQIRGAATSADALIIASEAFGSTGGPTMVTAIREAGVSLADLSTETETAEGYLSNLTAESATMQDKWAEATNNMKVAFEPVSRALISAVTWIVEGIVPALDGLKAAWRTVVGWFSGGSKDIEGSVAPLTGFFQNVSKAVGNAITFMGEVWDKFGRHVWEVVKVYFQVVFDVIKNVLTVVMEVVQVFVSLFAGDWGALWQNVKDLFSAVWTFIADFLTGILKIMWEGFKLFLRAVAELWKLAWKGIKALALAAWTGLKKLFTIRGGHLKDALLNVLKGINKVWQFAWDKIGDLVILAWIGIAKGVEWGVNLVIGGIESGINAAIGLLNQFVKLVNKVPGVSIPLVPEVSFARVDFTAGLESKLAERRADRAAREQREADMRFNENAPPATREEVEEVVVDLGGDLAAGLDGLTTSKDERIAHAMEMQAMREELGALNARGGLTEKTFTMPDIDAATGFTTSGGGSSDITGSSGAASRNADTGGLEDRDLLLTINLNDEVSAEYEIPLTDLIDGETRDMRARGGQVATRPRSCG